MTHALSEEEFRKAMVAPAEAQRALVNAIRRSLARVPVPLSLGGSMALREP